MSRTNRGEKPSGFQYWSKRPGNNMAYGTPGPFTKKYTHHRERLQGRLQCKHERSQ